METPPAEAEQQRSKKTHGVFVKKLAGISEHRWLAATDGKELAKHSGRVVLV